MEYAIDHIDGGESITPPTADLVLRSNYLVDVFDPGHLVGEVAGALKDVNYDTLIGTGLSGALAVPHVARALGKKWAIVRKENDGSHSLFEIEGTIGARWVFLDDLVSSGTTEQRVMAAVARVTDEWAHPTEYVGTYEYERRRWNPRIKETVFGGTYDRELGTVIYPDDEGF